MMLLLTVVCSWLLFLLTAVFSIIIFSQINFILFFFALPFVGFVAFAYEVARLFLAQSPSPAQSR